MLSIETKRKIDNARDVLVGKIPNPQTQIEQITTALIYKFMDDMDEKSKTMGGKARFFVGDFEKYSWRTLLDPRMGGQERMNLYSEAVQKLSQNPALPQIFRDIFKDAFVPYRDPETLSLFLKEINWFDYHHSEELGNAYEYLLSIMGSQGDAGQFRTPRHIIDFIVEAVDPQKDETVLDPACGTAGFLISAYKHILRQNDGIDDVTGLPSDKEIKLSPEERAKLLKNFAGYDISPEMVKLSLVNMYLHGFVMPDIEEYDSLTYDDHWNDDFDVILANPPFMTPKGGVRPHKRFQIQANRAEVLFVDYIAEHLKPKGRAGIVVPEGIIFQSGTAYKSLRKMLVEEQGLWAVISLPAGVFQPYSGVKTSILLLDKERAKLTDEVLFIEINHDGFSLGAQRNPIKQNDFPEALNVMKMWSFGDKVESSLANWVSKKSIATTNDYWLTVAKHKIVVNVNSEYSLQPIKEVAEVIAGQSPKGEFYNEVGEGTPFYQGKTEFTNYYIGAPKKWTSQVTKLSIPNDIIMSVRAPVGPVNLVNQRICIGRGLAALRVNPEKVIVEFLFHILKTSQDKFKALSSGSTFEAINRESIENFVIPVPPIDIQKQIVDELDGYQKIIDGAQQVIDNWKPSFKINIDWPLVQLSEICDVRDGTHDSPKYIDEGYPLITSKNLKNRSIDFINVNYISKEDHDAISKRSGVDKGDVLFAMIGTIGNPVVVRDNRAFSIKNVALFKFPKGSKVTNEYLALLLESSYAEQNLLVHSRGGTQKFISLKDIRNFEIPVPPIELQKSIIDEIVEEREIVERNRRVIEIYNNKIKDKLAEVWGE